MNDAQKWLEAAAGIEQDLEYCKNDLSEDDVSELLLAMAMFRGNATTGVPWPSPDDLYCIQRLPYGTKSLIATDMRRDFKFIC
jgi:hypothetical protein